MSSTTTLEEGAHQAARELIETIAKEHHRREAALADKLVEGVLAVRPDVDQDRLNETADWYASTVLSRLNAAARALLAPELEAAFAQPLEPRRGRDVRRLIAVEGARVEAMEAVVQLQPVLDLLDLGSAA